MSRMIALLVMVSLSGPAFAADTAKMFINGGLSFVGFKVEDNAGNSIKFDDGTGLNLAAGIRGTSGFGGRLSFMGSGHDGGTACGPGCVTFNNDASTGEFRLSGTYDAKMSDALTLDFGIGWERLKAKVESAFDVGAKGLVLEGALLINATPTLRFDVGLGLLGLRDDASDDKFNGAEFKAGMIVNVGRVDLGVGLRGLHLESDQSGTTVKADLGEFKLTIGTTFDI